MRSSSDGRRPGFRHFSDGQAGASILTKTHGSVSNNLWCKTAVDAPEAGSFQGERSVDLAVIGGGYTGLSAALTAAEQGAEVTLLEAEFVGHGGSGRNVGLVNAGLWLPPEAVNARLGPEAGERLNAALAAAPDVVFGLIERHAMACEPVRAGTLHLAHAHKGLKDLENRAAQLATRGAPVRLLDATETARRTGSDRFHGALHDPRAGTIQPLGYARGLARAAQNAGARLHEKSPVVAVQQVGGQWILRTSGGKLRARHLIVATNAYHQPIDQTPFPAMPIVQYFQIATEPLGDNLAGDILMNGEGCWDTGLIMTSLRRDRAGRLILGGMGGGGRIHEDWARRKLMQLYPRLRDARIAHSWSGRIAMTGDHLPRIHRFGINAFAIYGYSGRGIGPGTVFGRAVAQALINQSEMELPVPAIEDHREPFVRLKTMAYEAGARLAHLTAARS
ncbi:MAG: FAD-dependent oxidoreductase [Alphaproteobacteria bacterium HGW-Alphaproteobacteria-1]|nr:MAG: FAD-dependent oxidoreductase [Alphaproteobacteria bacterium HGW-Alphaproteobacteria-1]